MKLVLRRLALIQINYDNFFILRSGLVFTFALLAKAREEVLMVINSF